MSTTRSRTTGKFAERLDRHRARGVVGQEGRAGQPGLPVDVHPAAAADAHPARPPERQRRVDLVLDVVEPVEDRPLLAQRYVVLLPPRLRVLVGAVPRHPQADARRPCLTSRRPARPGAQRVIVTGSRSTRGGPSSSRYTSWWTRNRSSSRSGKVGALVGAPRLLALQPGREDALGDVEHVGHLERGHQLGVEGPAGVADPDPRRPAPAARGGRRRPWPWPGRCGRCRRPPPSSPASRRGSPRRSRRPRHRAQHVALDPAHLVGRLGRDRGRRPRRRSAAYSAAARPARAPKTRHSGSELEPSRLAPLMLTQAVSPAAYSPASGVAPSMSVWTPPIM